MPDEITLLLSDKLIALNNYLLKLTVSGGQLTMKLTDAAEDVTMGMGALPSYILVLLAPANWRQPVRSGGGAGKLAFPGCTFPRQSNYINEYFLSCCKVPQDW